MGEHQRDITLKVISFLEEFGQVLKYHTKREEYMFPGFPTSPILDLTWRRTEQERFPLFIFEVESTPQKAASDNVVKVFSRPTEMFVKPLFFFHVFVDQVLETDRIKSLGELFDKTNYGAYLLSDSTDKQRLISDILDQHLRIELAFSLYALVELLESYDELEFTTLSILENLVQKKYDRVEDAEFVPALERLIIAKGYPTIKQFYLSYLKTYLSYSDPLLPKYEFLSASVYSLVIHHALLLLVSGQPSDHERTFSELIRIENSWRYWSGWKLNLQLSNDHDQIAPSDFPLLLTMITVAFSNSRYAVYFSKKLRAVIEEAQRGLSFYVHGLIWLLIASQIAQDEESYEFARSLINQSGGIPLNLIVKPSIHIDDAHERINNPEGNLAVIPDYSSWAEWLSHQITPTEADKLNFIIKGFLLFPTDWDNARYEFSMYCVSKSVSPKSINFQG